MKNNFGTKNDIGFENHNLRSPGKRMATNKTKIEKNCKSSLKKDIGSKNGILPSLQSEQQNKNKLSKIKKRFKDASASNLLSISDDLEEPWFSAHKKDNKENLFFKIGSIDTKNVQKESNGSQNKKLLSDLFRNQSKQMLIDSSFSSRESSEERVKDVAVSQESKIQVNSLNITGLNDFPDVERKIKEAENLKSFYFMPFNTGKVEMVEIPTCSQDIRNRVKIHNHLYTSEAIQKGMRLNSTQSRYKNQKESKNTSGIISRNNSNINLTNFAGSRSQQK